MFSVKDISKILADIPQGAWVALSNDEERVLAFGAELHEVVAKAKAAGENDPVVTRVPETDSATLSLLGAREGLSAPLRSLQNRAESRISARQDCAAAGHQVDGPEGI